MIFVRASRQGAKPCDEFRGDFERSRRHWLAALIFVASLPVLAAELAPIAPDPIGYRSAFATTPSQAS